MCAAMTRWVSYNVASSGTAGTGNNECKGTRGYSLATASVGDSFTVGSTTNRLHLNIGGVADYITLYSGSNLDARFVARDITEKIRAVQKIGIKLFAYGKIVMHIITTLLYTPEIWGLVLK